MATAESPNEERLVDLLDAALTDFQAGKTLDPQSWSRQCSEWTDEAPALLQTLQELVRATEDWRSISSGRGTAGAPTADYVAAPVIGGGATLSAAASPPLGQLGRYRLLERLGSGGMGVVYKGFDPELNRLVAVKVPRLDPGAPEHAAFMRRLQREARAAAAVRHPHVCPVYDVGEQDGVTYLVMAYVEGESLAMRLGRAGRFDHAAEAVRIVRQVAEGLVAVHAHGMVHRDLKPANILLDAQGQAVLSDFGLAFLREAEERLSGAGVVVGTLRYMAPEQAADGSAPPGPTADQYSLGVVLFEMLCGQAPLARAGMTVARNRLLYEEPPPLRELRPDVDAGLAALVARAMAKDPVQRFPTVQAFADALGVWLSGTGPANVRPGSEVRRRAFRVGLGLVAVVLVAFIALLVAGRPRPGLPDPSTAAVVNPPREEPLKGDLLVTLSTDPAKPHRPEAIKRRIPVDQPAALPVRNGELVHLEVRLNRPAYVYLLWVDSQGEIQPAYPWDIARSKRGWRAPWVREGHEPRGEVHCPADEDEGLRVIGPQGLETAVLLARSTPLPEEVDLEQLAGKLPPSPLQHPGEVAWLGLAPGEVLARHERPPLNRGVAAGESRKIDASVFDLLEKRLRRHFELLKAVRFAHAE
jgi:hypothetical protein